MARFYYDKYGNLKGRSLSSQEVSQEAWDSLCLVLFLFVLGPVMVLAYGAFLCLRYVVGIHPVFSILIVGLPVSAFLRRFLRVRSFRLFYCSMMSVMYGIVFFFSISKAFDPIWGTAAGLLSGAIGIGLARHFCRA